MKRRDNESFEDYKARREAENERVKKVLRGVPSKPCTPRPHLGKARTKAARKMRGRARG
jgi:hypothetical protein